jgi:hypothetical protein
MAGDQRLRAHVACLPGNDAGVPPRSKQELRDKWECLVLLPEFCRKLHPMAVGMTSEVNIRTAGHGKCEC